MNRAWKTLNPEEKTELTRRNWPKGWYIKECRECHQTFMGPKREPVCYLCLEAQTTVEKFVSPCALPTPHEREILDILIEECSEVIQRATKMLRFGVEEIQPGQEHNNRQRLSFEIGDLKHMIDRAIDLNLVSPANVRAGEFRKAEQLQKYLQTIPETKE